MFIFSLILSISLVCPTPTPPKHLNIPTPPLSSWPLKAMAHKLGSAPSQYFQREAANPRAQSHNLSSTSTGWVAPTVLVNTVSFILSVRLASPPPLLFSVWLSPGLSLSVHLHFVFMAVPLYVWLSWLLSRTKCRYMSLPSLHSLNQNSTSFVPVLTSHLFILFIVFLLVALLLFFFF